MGDAAAERIGVIADPEVRVRDLGPDDRFVILATDGVWEFINNQEAVDLVASIGDPQRAAAVEVIRRRRHVEVLSARSIRAVQVQGRPGAGAAKGSEKRGSVVKPASVRLRRNSSRSAFAAADSGNPVTKVLL